MESQTPRINKILVPIIIVLALMVVGEVGYASLMKKKVGNNEAHPPSRPTSTLSSGLQSAVPTAIPQPGQNHVPILDFQGAIASIGSIIENKSAQPIDQDSTFFLNIQVVGHSTPHIFYFKYDSLNYLTVRDHLGNSVRFTDLKVGQRINLKRFNTSEGTVRTDIKIFQ